MTVDDYLGAPPTEEITLFRASFAQQRMWFLHRLDPRNPYYNVPLVLRLHGAVRVDALQRALDGLVLRHEVLRTDFVEVDGELMQAVAADSSITVEHAEIDVPNTRCAPGDLHPQVRARVLDLVRVPFDLRTGPLLRAHLLDLTDGDHLLVLTMHHIIVDGWSLGLICEELRVLYTAEVTGVPAQLPPMELQVGDMAEDEFERLSGPARANHLAYWREQLAGELTAPALPFDRDRPEESNFRGASFTFTLTPAETAAVAAFGRDANSTAFTTLLAAFYALIYRYSGSGDQVVGVPMANREDSRKAALIGLFVNTVPLRAQIDTGAGFTDLVTQVRELSSGAYEHQDLPLEQIVDQVAPGHLPGRNPLFAVLFAMQGAPPAEFDFAGTPVTFVAMSVEATRADLEMHFWQHGDHLTGKLVYGTERFDAATIEQLSADYVTLLRSAMATPNDPIDALPIGAGSAVQIVSPTSLLEHPADSVAVVGAGVAVTHAELRATAAALAGTLTIGSDGVVALATDRGPDLACALVAAAAAGARRVVWLPPSLPAPYRRRSLAELQPTHVIDAEVVVAARAADTTDPLPVASAFGRLDGALADILWKLAHIGTVDLDDRGPAQETVLTADRRLAPPGVLGELYVGDPDRGVIATGVPARRRADSTVDVAHGTRGLVSDGYRWADVTTVEAVLLGSGLIDDCAILERRNDSGETELVAYVAAVATVVAPGLVELARAALPASLVPRAFVPVTALPMTESGALDVAALRRLPVIDDELITRWSTRVPDARVTVVPDVEDVPRIHVGDVPQTDAGDARATPTPWEVAPEPANGEPAVLDGGPSVTPAVSTLPDALVRAAHDAAGTTLTFLDEAGDELTLTYRELLGTAGRVLGGLRESGLAAGDLAIVCLPRNDDFVAAVWGCFLGGIVPVPVDLNSAGGVEKAAAAWDMLEGPLIVGDSAVVGDAIRSLTGRTARVASIDELRAHEADTAHHAPEPDALALLLLTSGSTGRPKAVQLSHRNILAREAASAQHNGFSSEDVSFNWMPLEHVGGIVMYHLHDVYLCCRQIHAATGWVLADPLRWLKIVDRYRVTNTWAPSFAFGLVAERLAEASLPDDEFDLRSLRFILNGGEAIVARTARRFLRMLERFGLPSDAMHPSWGMSETSSGVTFSDRFTLARTADTDEFVDLGTPVPGTRVRVVDVDDSVVGVGRTGRVQICGPTVTRGYYADAERTRESFSDDGWFDTGDLGVVRDGTMTLTGRAKDLIVVNGVNYTCHAIESAVEESPFVVRSTAAAVAVRPPGSDTDALAIVFSPRSPDQEDEAVADIRARVLAAGPNPDFLIPVSQADIPKTDIGKIQRTALRERFAAGEFTDIVRRVEVAAGSVNTVPNWFFRPIWRRRDRLRGAASVDGAVLLVGSGGGIGASLVDRLTGQNVAVTQIPVEAIAAGLGASAATESIDTVVLFVDEPTEREIGGDESKPFSRSVFDVAAVIRALSESPRPRALHVVATGAQPVTATEEASGALAPIPALLRSAAAETPGLRVRFIDLDPRDTVAAAGQVAGELSDPGNDIQVAYRAGSRWVKGLQRLPAEAVTSAGITPGAIHLISGGMGGLAHELARLLIERFDGRVLLIGRRERDDEQLANYRRLCDIAGEQAVRFAVADVCDADAVSDALAAAETDWGDRLSTIWHLAGTYREQPLASTTAAELTDVAAAKVGGVQALHRIALRRPGIRFVSFSSVNGFFGGATVAGYSAANAYLDGFTLYQRSCGINAQSIAWTMWDRVGMSAHSGHPEIADALGYRILGRAEGINSLLVALADGGPHVLVGLDDTKPMIRARSIGRPVRQLLVAESTRDVPSSAGLPLHDRFGGLVPTRIELVGQAREQVSERDDTERAVAAIWRQVLGAGGFSMTDSFFELGGSSVLLARVQELVQVEFDRPVPMADLFRYPTVSSLAAYLSGAEAESDAVQPAPNTGSDRGNIRKQARRRTRPSRR